MTDNLPNPESRKETYLAKAAGMTVEELPTPASREELYLNAIAEGGGGGGGTSYTAGDGIDITNDIISATNTGKARVLNTDDYNWPASAGSTKDSVAIWLLEPGIYSLASGVSYRLRDSQRLVGEIENFVVGEPNNGRIPVIKYYHQYDGVNKSRFVLYTVYADGSQYTSDFGFIQDNLTSTNANAPLSANQGKVLKDMIDALPTGGVTELTSADYNWPTNNPDGIALWLLEPGLYYAENAQVYMSSDQIGDRTDHGTFIIGGDYGTNPAKLILYYDQVAPAAYLISTVISSGYRNSKTSLLSPNVTQSTGTSTSSVMSQNAVTSMVFADPSTGKRVQIGNAITSADNAVAMGYNAKASSDYSIAIGSNSYSANAAARAIGGWAIAIGRGTYASGNYSVAVGDGATASQQGQFDIGTGSQTTVGYNSSNYRLLTGLYDGQSAHDAATVAQGNTLATSAPTTSTVGVLGQLYTDTTNMHTYQCTAIDDVTDPSSPVYTWTQRW